MPLASDHNTPTFSWIQRSTQITEFQALKDTVKRLERASREQLLLENESQSAFSHISSEVATLKQAVTALSSVVDGELEGLRVECQSLRGDFDRVLKTSVEAMRAEVESTVKLAMGKVTKSLAEAQRRDFSLLSGGVGQIKEVVTRLEEESQTSREKHEQLSREVVRLEGAMVSGDEAASSALEQHQVEHKRSISEVTTTLSESTSKQFRRASERLDEVVERLDTTGQRITDVDQRVASRLDALGESGRATDKRVSDAEAAAAVVRSELDSQLMPQQESFRKWSDEARETMAGLRVDVDATRIIVEAERVHASEQDARHEAAASGLDAAVAEGKRHRDAIALLVESVDTHSREAKAEEAALGVRLQATSDSLTQQLTDQISRTRSDLESRTAAVEKRVDDTAEAVAAKAAREAREVQEATTAAVAQAVKEASNAVEDARREAVKEVEEAKRELVKDLESVQKEMAREAKVARGEVREEIEEARKEARQATGEAKHEAREATLEARREAKESVSDLAKSVTESIDAHARESKREASALGCRITEAAELLGGQLVERWAEAKETLEARALVAERRANESAEAVAAGATREAREVQEGASTALQALAKQFSNELTEARKEAKERVEAAGRELTTVVEDAKQHGADELHREVEMVTQRLGSEMEGHRAAAASAVQEARGEASRGLEVARAESQEAATVLHSTLQAHFEEEIQSARAAAREGTKLSASEAKAATLEARQEASEATRQAAKVAEERSSQLAESLTKSLEGLRQKVQHEDAALGSRLTDATELLGGQLAQSWAEARAEARADVSAAKAEAREAMQVIDARLTAEHREGVKDAHTATQAVQTKLDQVSSELARSARSSASELTEKVGQEAARLRRELKDLGSNTERELEPLREALQILDEQMAARLEAEGQARHETSRHAERLRTAEGGLDALKQELNAANAQARMVKSAGREAADQLEAQKQFVRRAIERVDKRHDAFDQAIAVLADALKIADPLTATISSSSLSASPAL